MICDIKISNIMFHMYADLSIGYFTEQFCNEERCVGG